MAFVCVIADDLLPFGVQLETALLLGLAAPPFELEQGSAAGHVIAESFGSFHLVRGKGTDVDPLLGTADRTANAALVDDFQLSGSQGLSLIPNSLGSSDGIAPRPYHLGKPFAAVTVAGRATVIVGMFPAGSTAGGGLFEDADSGIACPREGVGPVRRSAKKAPSR